MASGINSATNGTTLCPADFDTFLPYFCRQMATEFKVKVIKTIQEDLSIEEKGDKTRRTRSFTTKTLGTQHSALESPDIREEEESDDESEFEVPIRVVYDNVGRLVELGFVRCKQIPRVLLKIIKELLNFQSYVVKVFVRFCKFTAIGLYELNKILVQSSITEVCLDDSPVLEANYEMLLEGQSRLRRLSLARCRLGDDACERLALCLHHPSSASRHLVSLTLSSNRITDRGVYAMALALRSNRSLYHLDLAANFITDDGALALLSTLVEFPLTYSEILNKRGRHFEYLKQRSDIYKRCYADLLIDTYKSLDTVSSTSKRRVINPKSRKSPQSIHTTTFALDDIADRAEVLAAEIVGPHIDPFNSNDTVSREGYVFCIGNLTLSYLNLAYNTLSHLSILKIIKVMSYQRSYCLRPIAGLVRIVIDGNELPTSSSEIEVLQDSLDRIYTSQRYSFRMSSKKPRRSRSVHTN